MNHILNTAKSFSFCGTYFRGFCCVSRIKSF